MRSLDRAFKSRLNGTGLKPLVQYIKDLFKNNEEGVWYDPSDFERYMSALGPELVTNGDFSQGTTGWSGANGGVLSVANGEITVTNELSSVGRAAQMIATKIGKTYRLTAQARIGSATFAQLGWGTVLGSVAGGSVTTTSTTATTLSMTFVATTTSTGVAVGNGSTTTGNTSIFDNISVRELTAIDTATLYQDAAGTIPVTAVEQPVGRILDKSGRGNHASQTTATSRPVLSARVNQFLNSELTGAVAGVPGTPPTSWFNGNAAGEIRASAEGTRFVANVSRRLIYQGFSAQANSVWVFSCKVRIETTSQIQQLLGSTSPAVASTAYYVDGALVPANFAPTVGEHEIKCVVTVNSTGGTTIFQLGVGVQNNVTCDVTFLRADLRPANTGTNLPDYQRVNTATDYDTAGFPKYIRYDNIDDVSNVKFPTTLGSNCTIARGSVGGSSTILTGQSIGDTYGINMTHSGLMILNRPLTNTETKNVIKYLYQKGTR